MVTKQEEEERNKSLENTDSMKLLKKKSFSYFNSLNVCLKRCANTRKRLQKQIVSDFFILFENPISFFLCGQTQVMFKYPSDMAVPVRGLSLKY